MSDLNAQSLIEKYLTDGRIMQLATVRDGQPWVCNLHFAIDGDSNIYWLSKSTRRHSNEISDHPNAAITFAVKTEHPVIGVQSEGTAEVVTDQAVIERVTQNYIERHHSDKAFIDKVIRGDGLDRLYKFTPRRFSLFDLQNFPDNPQQEWIIKQ